jgi:hypothetical protein
MTPVITKAVTNSVPAAAAGLWASIPIALSSLFLRGA